MKRSRAISTVLIALKLFVRPDGEAPGAETRSIGREGARGNSRDRGGAILDEAVGPHTVAGAAAPQVDEPTDPRQRQASSASAAWLEPF